MHLPPQLNYETPVWRRSKQTVQTRTGLFRLNLSIGTSCAEHLLQSSLPQWRLEQDTCIDQLSHMLLQCHTLGGAHSYRRDIIIILHFANIQNNISQESGWSKDSNVTALARNIFEEFVQFQSFEIGLDTKFLILNLICLTITPTFPTKTW